MLPASISSFLILAVSICLEQKPGTDPVDEDTTRVIMAAEQMPEFTGGYEGLLKFLKKNSRYPERAEGIVYVSFIVSADGTTRDPYVVRGVSRGYDAEALRLVRIMPPWKPGKQKGVPVAVRMHLPIRCH